MRAETKKRRTQKGNQKEKKEEPVTGNEREGEDEKVDSVLRGGKGKGRGKEEREKGKEKRKMVHSRSNFVFFFFLFFFFLGGASRLERKVSGLKVVRLNYGTRTRFTLFLCFYFPFSFCFLVTWNYFGDGDHSSGILISIINSGQLLDTSHLTHSYDLMEVTLSSTEVTP